jgi:hypothetical protein
MKDGIQSCGKKWQVLRFWLLRLGVYVCVVQSLHQALCDALWQATGIKGLPGLSSLKFVHSVNIYWGTAM